MKTTAALTAPPADTAEPWLFGSAATRPHRVRHPAADDRGRLPAAVLFDRDGTLVQDVPYNGDPRRVRPMPGARAALARLRRHDVPLGVVSNQSGVARGLLSYRQVEAVRHRVEDLLGPFDVWAVCPHGPGDACGCRKPAPGLIRAACRRLGVPPHRTVVIGDIGSDLAAAHAAGAAGILVPTPATLPAEVATADRTAHDLPTAVRDILTARHPAGPAPQDRA
ncbi:D-glycero-alpha-D-manno-heptose-1,7-bisphosphate 7-phosphatase [Streptomyces sp. NPDC018031]|uniref:D-glycero-alpha-D-manno-heptose-1,7-bisphosphate 7-phosphatase n=1 Tax=Streptomyces sp. NPDC018031 TaxID=3365033 RepID=UPI0037AAAB0B